ncbi:nuclear transport factor 2 family protein [Limnohabitans sp. Hippo4]|uniref:nuclear transport factor 2 family protein n=1 Tax=Limnohabitans sp. Hippo4 TaxID=1826167 RepID=UPI0013050516|nr:nuclear transport factor 2 family protein [Limnohabitans sp. Hippo4]
MSLDPKSVILAAFKAVDNADAEALLDMMADDITQIDEISKKWSRGKAEVAAVVRPMFDLVKSIKSSISDVHVQTSNDIAIVTFMLDQSYVFEGQQVAIVAPTSCVLRQEKGVWKFVLIHTMPFADS